MVRTMGLAVILTAVVAAGDIEAAMRRIEIDSRLVDCAGVGRQRCMRVRDGEDQPWRMFYGSIEGFTFEPGYRYVLRVEEIAMPNPPADASSVRTVLVEQVRKVAVEPPADPFLGKVWRLFELQAAADAVPMHPTVPITLAIDSGAGRASGKGGCNRYFAGVTLAGTQLAMAGIGATQMACPPPAMKEEAAYLAALERVTGYAVDNDVLTLTLAGGGRLRYRELLD